jgi:hypothetical protein
LQLTKNRFDQYTVGDDDYIDYHDSNRLLDGHQLRNVTFLLERDLNYMSTKFLSGYHHPRYMTQFSTMLWGLCRRLSSYMIALGIPILIIGFCGMVGMWMQVKEGEGRVTVVVTEIRQLEDMYKEKNNQLWNVYKDKKVDVISKNRSLRELWVE